MMKNIVKSIVCVIILSNVIFTVQAQTAHSPMDSIYRLLLVENRPTDGVNLLNELAAVGDEPALFTLGCCYYTGTGVIADKDKAFELWKQAAQKAFPEASFNMGWCYERGMVVTPNLEQSIFYYTSAAVKEFSDAQYRLGNLYYNSKNECHDFNEAVYWYKKAVTAGNAHAMRGLSACYRYGRGVEQDLEYADELLNKAAGYGDARAKRALDLSQEDVLDQPQLWLSLRAAGAFMAVGDTARAVPFYQQSAIQGNGTACCELGKIYYNGARNVQRNYDKAARLFDRACSSGSIYAAYYLSICYANAQGVPYNRDRAVNLLEYAANNGIREAQLTMAECYDKGILFERNALKASLWRNKAQSNEAPKTN